MRDSSFPNMRKHLEIGNMKKYIAYLTVFLCIAAMPFSAHASDQDDRYAGAMPGQYVMPETPSVNVFTSRHELNPRSIYRPPAFRGGAPATGDSSVILYPLVPAVPTTFHHVPRPAVNVPHHHAAPVSAPSYQAVPNVNPGAMPMGGMPSPEPDHSASIPSDGENLGPMEAYVRRFYGYDDPAAESEDSAGKVSAMPARASSRAGHAGVSKPKSTAPHGHAPGKILFDHGSDALDAQDIGVIRRMAKRYSLYPRGTRFLVQGHASKRAEANDPRGKRIANLKMSSSRAYQVSRRLIMEGVPSTAIETTAFGDTHPVPPAAGRSTEALSRRVEIYVDAY